MKNFIPLCLLALSSIAPERPNIVSGDAPAPLRGVYEVAITSDADIADQYLGLDLKVTFTRPDASTVTVEGFYDGVDNGKPLFKARAYCDHPGRWSWTSSSKLPTLDGRAGAFAVSPSSLPGKLRKHPNDPHQLAYDNGEWFLHIGDTGYRYVVDTEPEWQAYLDQAVTMGATKIRTWFCRSRSGVEALFADNRARLDLAYWQEIDRRVQYALNRHPQLILQLIPYGEDAQELLRYSQGDPVSRFVAQYAQARFSAYPNVIWCISNDQTIDRKVPASVIDAIGRDMASREPWGTLLTNHQARRTGYAFTGAPWSDIVTLEDLDQVGGDLVLEYRERADDPVIIDEDRYELHETPANAQYFFRRLMWASLLSGGSATYGGARTYEPYDGRDRGVRGYYDLKNQGILKSGADSFVHIHTFFKESGLTLAGMRPADAMAGGDPRKAKAIASDRALIVYLANPDDDVPEKANAAQTNSSCRLLLPAGKWALRWFNPGTALWCEDPSPNATGGGSPGSFTAPFKGDAVLLATRATP